MSCFNLRVLRALRGESFPGFYRPFPLRKERPANLTRRSIATVGGAVLPAVEDDSQVQLVPVLPRKEFFQIHLGLHHIPAVAELPPLRESVNVGVHRERRHPERLRHHHARRLVPHPRQRLQLGKGPRHPAAVPRHHQVRQPRNRLRLLRRQPARPDHALDLRHRDACHFLRRIRQRPEVRRDEINPLVRALRRQQHRHQQRVRIPVIQRHRRRRIQLRQPPVHVIGPDLARGKIRGGFHSVTGIWNPEMLEPARGLFPPFLSSSFQVPQGNRPAFGPETNP
jgi:hypothetical protein